MTSSNSPEAVADPASSSAAAPYGTRSRGRNAPRPNYAEDRDIEMELEPAPSKTNKRTSGVALTNIVNDSKLDEKTTSPAQSRKSLTNGSATNVITKDAKEPKESKESKDPKDPKDPKETKESIPGTSSFSSRPDEVNGSALRKRKQPASTPNAGSTGNASKKIFTTAPGDSEGGYFTNMVSFEKSGPHLKDGQLTADDGTTFAVNGLFTPVLCLPSLMTPPPPTVALRPPLISPSYLHGQVGSMMASY